MKKKNRKYLTNLSAVYNLLTPKEKRHFYYLFVGAIFIGMVDVVGVGSIMPFLAVATQQDIIFSNEYLNSIYKYFHFTDAQNFLVALGILVLGFLLLSNAFRVLMRFMQAYFVNMRRHSLSLRLMKNYLGQSYSFFLKKNSHEFVKNIIDEVQQLINLTIIQIVEAAARVAQLLLITVFLFVINPVSTSIIIGIILFVYGVIYLLIKRKLHSLGQERYDKAADRARIVSETFWGIKEVKVMGLEGVFLDEYEYPSKRLAINDVYIRLIGDIPKFVLESTVFSVIMVIMLQSIVKSGGFETAAMSISVYAYAGYKIMPALQALFKAVSNLKYGVPTAQRMLGEFYETTGAEPPSRQPAKPLTIRECLNIKNITFKYSDSNENVLSNVDIEIRANSTIGVIGKTGSGKSTLIDVILGLHHPQFGAMFVDGFEITSSNQRNWQANIGYVPQFIYLSNSSIAHNIAFGVPDTEIDMNAVRHAAKMAQIDDFIVSELPKGYVTTIGERGVRLSGGQRQRIGIARALYRNPGVLILDEATSALDGTTEDAVMQSIESLMGSLTIIMIAHRYSTLKNCDKIFLLEGGRVIKEGTYQDFVR